MAQAQLQIDLDAITANWRALDRISGPGVETAAVVKADAYGLGLKPVANTLAAAGARCFFVALAEEGATLRQILGPGPEIFVFSGHMSGDAPLISDAALVPLLNTPDQITRHRSALPGHAFGLQLDTGMNRLGLEEADWMALAPSLIDEGPRLVMSHLACADLPDHPMNATQLAAFRRMTGGLNVQRSLAATGGTLLGPDYHFDLIRPGIGLFGGAPFSEALPVVKLDLPVLQLRSVQAGESVGYGNTWIAPASTLVALLGAGYADGLFRALSHKATVHSGAVPCPVVGRVSMDTIAVDVGHLENVPDWLEVLGAQQSIDSLADAAGTIGYEVLTALGSRYQRHYAGSAT
ncbi:MAG: alanine racemase [Albidovulum sp.]